jgi:hypothetical protein
MVMLISSSICMTSVEVKEVQWGGWEWGWEWGCGGWGGGGGASGFARDLALLFIGFQSLSAGGRYFIEPILFTSSWSLYYLLS